MADPYSGATTSGSSATGTTGSTGANNWLTQLDSFAGSASQGLGIAEGLARGGARGDIQAATSAAKLGANLGVLGPGAASTLGTVGQFGAVMNNLSNIFQGVQQGGVSGYTGAGINAAALTGNLGQLGWKAGLLTAGETQAASEIASVANPLAAAYSVYQFAKNWQSGNTGQDALQGAETGASIGTAILPGIGTLVGAGLGAAAGALTSAFGGGRADLETQGWDQLAGKFNALSPEQQSQVVFSPAQAMENLAGTMDAKNNSPGHSQPIEQVFGRMGENNLVQQMTSQINAQIASGAISKNASVNDIYNQVVAPWLASKGASINMNERTSTGQAEGPALVQSLKSVIGAWQSGALTSATKVGIQGQTIGNLQPYGAGSNSAQAQQQQSMVQQMTTQFQNMMTSFPLGRVARH